MNGIATQAQQRALLMQERLLMIDQTVKWQFIELGYWMVEDKERGYWQYLCDPEGNPYHSHDDYMTRGTPFSRWHCYKAQGVVEKWAGKIPREDMQQIARGNFDLLEYIPERKLQEWIPAAKELLPQKFRDKIIAQEPDLHLEKNWRMSFDLYRSQYEAIEGKLKQTMKVHEIGREAALELWAAEREEDVDQ